MMILVMLWMKSDFTFRSNANSVFVKKTFIKSPEINISRMAIFFIFPYFMSV